MCTGVRRPSRSRRKEGALSATASTNLALLPVNRLEATVDGDEAADVSWSHSAAGGVDGFRLWGRQTMADGTVTKEVLLKELPNGATGYEDEGWTGSGTREYRIAAVDRSGEAFSAAMAKARTRKAIRDLEENGG